MGTFFDANGPGDQTNLMPTTNWSLCWGLELGPMLLGTNAPSTGSGLSIRGLILNGPERPGVPGLLLTWPTGTLQQPDVVTGPYSPMSNAASPTIIPPTLPAQKFYRLGP